MSELNENMENAIAIIGMTGRFPGAKNLDEFWNNLCNGVESVQNFSREQLIEMGIDKNLLDNPQYVPADAILDDMDKFDAGFFGYSAREAEIMDPQHRLFLESAWEVLESAGYSSELYDGRIAVYAGANLSSYMIRNIYSNPALVRQLGSFKIMIANGQDFLATKVSHKMNLMGPSVNVNTLCSSSMVAVHFACQNLLNYGCDIAIAGGVSLQVTRNEAFFYQEGGIGSADGHCRAFDAKANGTVSGSGLAIVVLKRLEDAIADGDYIHAVIRGTGINNDGAVKNSYTAPSVDGQSQCIAEAIAMSGVNPETITYIDAHGTGTNLGDPIEIAALTKAYRAYTDKKQYCAIGSVKTNIGHLVHAGGLASLIKTVLSMQHRQIPPSLNFEEPNPKIDFVNSPFYVNTRLSKWESNGTPLRAGVSSFGIGGTNTHVILEEAPQIEPSEKSKRPWQLIILSAKTETALEKMTSNLAEYVKNHQELDLADIAFTLQVGRRNFAHKRFLVCRDKNDLITSLQNLQSDKVYTHFQKAKEQQTAFVFPHYERWYPEMGHVLYETEKGFRKTVDKCAEILMDLISRDIRNDMYNKSEVSDERISRIGMFVTEYALAKLLMSLEVTPDIMIGQGVGELVAACIAGVFSLEDALKLVSADDIASMQNVAEQVALKEPTIPFVSGVTGKGISDAEALDPNYWAELLNTSNAFEAGIEDMLKDQNLVLIEIGPDIVANIKTDDLPEANRDGRVIALMPGSFMGDEDYKFFIENIGRYWLYGGRVNWYKLYKNERRHRIPLPTYPFERQRYWIEPGKQNDEDEGGAALDKRPRPELETPYVAPRNDTERKIAEICEDILGYDKIGVNDDFFELGGHSLLAVAFIARLRKVFKQDISLERLFENTTVAKLSAIFGSESEDEDTSQDFEEGSI